MPSAHSDNAIRICRKTHAKKESVLTRNEVCSTKATPRTRPGLSCAYRHPWDEARNIFVMNPPKPLPWRPSGVSRGLNRVNTQTLNTHAPRNSYSSCCYE
ncbi:hypothetical protein IE53DRAFT_15427 [Violaceomyces palustris]|uniref:Uncharacterized protein n=1 Tax=Violaceomyces palustris TaxID=1673888 RepID=A0ACD0P2A0_9BASI|nr:hypothetical protein IE53DRAFT_15427 [Violaceomyces palustris]